MKNLINYKKCGLTLIEMLIAIAAVAILATIGYSSYLSFQVRQNRELAKHELIRAAAAMEKYYAQNGSYTTNGQWPTGLFESTVYGSNGVVYNIAMAGGTPNSQNFKILATPLAGSIQKDDGDICVDPVGHFTWPANGQCVLVSNSSQPVNKCSGQTQQPACSAGCTAGVAYQACSGNCDGVLICDGTYAPTGCSGNCNNSYIYVRNGTLLANGACNGHCAGVIFSVPRDWEARISACTLTTGNTSNCVCNTNGYGSCEGITIVYHD